MPATSRTRPTLELDYPMSLAVFDDYPAAQKAVDHLSDQEFPVENCMIVGTDLKQMERVTGRLTYGRAAAAGAASGAWFGLLVGLLLGLFAVEGEWISAVLTGVLLGIVFGLFWSLIGYALSGGRRDFTSVTQVVATRYEVLVEHKLLGRAQELLAQMPGRAVDW